MITLTAIQARYTAYSPKNTEEFSSASRSVKPGLIAAGIVSAWTWAATLVSPHLYTQSLTDVLHCLKLQSSAVAYKYGISGPWWYGAGATVQVLLFAQVCTDQNVPTFVHPNSIEPARGQAQAQRTVCAHLVRDCPRSMGAHSASHLHVFWVRSVYPVAHLPSLTCLIQASDKYNRFFYANPWWLCNGDKFNWYAYHSRVLPYPAWCCNLCRRWRYAGDATL